MKSFFQRVGYGVVSVVFFLKSLLSSFLGTFQYSPPKWWRPFSTWLSRSWVGRKWNYFQVWKQTNPKAYRQRSLAGLLTLGLLIAAGVGFKQYLDSRPVPDYVKISVTEPRPTDPETRQPQALKLFFSKSVARPEQLSRPIADGPKIEPAISGTWFWESDRTLVFTPDLAKGDWQVGTEYEVEFQKKFFASHLVFDSYEVEFSTRPLVVESSKSEFYIDPRNSDIKKVVVSYRTNYPVRVEDFTSHVEFQLETKGVLLTTKKVPFTITTNKFQNEFYLQSESLPLPRDSQTMHVKIDKGLKALLGGPGTKEQVKLSVNIPSLYEGLSISEISMAFARDEKFEPEQILVVKTSMDVKSEEIGKKLKLLLLPKDRPASRNAERVKNYQWSLAETTPELLQKADPVAFKVVPSSEEWSKVHTFKIESEPLRYLHVKIDGGLKGLGGYELKDKYEQLVRVEIFPQELSIMSQGSILTLSGDLKLPLLARNLDKVGFTLHRIIPDQVNHLLHHMTDDLTKTYLAYGLESQIAEKFETTQVIPLKSVKATQYFSFDLQPFLNKASAQKGIFLLDVRSKDTRGASDVGDRRLIMITDLGILVKETAAKTHEVFVQNLRTGLPVEGATVEVVGANGLTVLKTLSDSSGRASFPDLKSFLNEKKPIAFSVRHGQDQSFLPFRNYTRNLQYSRFDVGGLYESSYSDQLMSMLFSDRGIYRPGEQVRLGLIVRSKRGQSTNSKPPLEWVLTDPKGTELRREKLTLGTKDLSELDFKTDDTSPTGTYTVQVYLIKKEVPQRELELLGTHTVRVEEFQPDRMRILAKLAEEKAVGWIQPKELKALISLKNMFGTAAENRRVTADITLAPTAPYFKEFKDYTFTDLNPKDVQTFNEPLGDQTSDAKGEAEFTIDLTKYQANLFNLRLDVEGFEAEGGRSVRAGASTMVSPLDFILGVKPDGDLYYIAKNAERKIHVIALNSDVKLTAAEKLTLVTIERKSVSVLTQASDGTYKYQSVVKEIVLSEKPFAVAAKGTSLKLNTATAGDYTLVFRNSQKLDLLKVNYTIVGESNLTRALDRNAELQLSLNKSDFKTGEEIQMQIKAPYSGAGLITIERDGLYATKWFKTSSSTTMATITVPEGLDGNAYVNVTFLRAIDSNEIYASPLSYAVAPFSVSLDDHRTKIDLQAPALVKPGQKLKVQYSANKKTQMIVYGVDEGILQVARYKLPDPLSYFFQKRALQVKTYQMLDLLLPEFSLIREMQAAGGDGGFGAVGKNMNPFKSKRIQPVVFWSGVVTAEPTPKTYTFDVPEHFNGNIKIMAVSAGKEGLGSVQTESIVRGDLILSPNVPMFVAPQDEFVVGVSVANQTEKSGPEAQVHLETTGSKHFQVIDNKGVDLKIPEGRESSTQVRVKTLAELGVGDLTFNASLGAAKARLKVEVSVRPSTPYLHFLKTGVYSGSGLELKNPRKVYQEFSDIKMQAAASPFIMASGLVSYLETYPYQCTEQLISRAVPALVVRSMKEYLSDETKLKESFQTTLQILRTRQKPDGGFALYSPLYEANSHAPVSLYVAHYLIEAKAKGLVVPDDLLARVKNYLDSPGLRTAAGGLVNARRWAYALYLSARLGVVNGASLAQLRRELEKDHKGQWEKDVTGLFLAGTYSLYRQEELGEALIKNLRVGDVTTTDFENYLDPLARDAILLYIAGKHFPSKVPTLIDTTSMEVFMKPINEGRYQTHSVGRLLMAFDVLSNIPESQAALSALQLEVTSGKATSVVEPSKANPKVWKLGVNAESLKLAGGKGPLFYSFHASGFDRTIVPIKKNLEVARQYRNKEGKEVSSAKIGDELTVHLQARTLDGKTYANIAVVDLIPAGFEMVIDRETPAIEGGGLSPGGPAGGTNEGYDEGHDSGHGEGEGEGEHGEGEPEAYGDDALIRLLLPKAFAQAATTTALEPLRLQFFEKREDRMILYATLTPDLKEFTYRIKAVNEGKFVTAPTFAEGLYQRELQFLGTASKLEVTHQ